MRKCLGALLSLLFAGLAHATTYDYTGAPYSQYVNPFTASESVTGWITLAAPLSPNLVHADITSQVLDWSFTDAPLPGETYSKSTRNINGNLIDSLDSAVVSTDARSQITAWSVTAGFYNYPAVNLSSPCSIAYNGGLYCDLVFYSFGLGETTLAGGGQPAATTTAGSWVDPPAGATVVPEPGTGMLLALGLVLAALVLQLAEHPHRRLSGVGPVL